MGSLGRDAVFAENREPDVEDETKVAGGIL
jgi:hypothetical protein